MRPINYIVLHTTASAVTATADSINRYHKKVLNWQSPGYHFIIERDGKVVDNWPITKPSNGVKGHNHDSINISYIGGIDEKSKPVDNRTPQQKAAMAELVNKLAKQFPKADVLGHRNFPNVAKACPCFDAKKWWATVKKS